MIRSHVRVLLLRFITESSPDSPFLGSHSPNACPEVDFYIQAPDHPEVWEELKVSSQSSAPLDPDSEGHEFPQCPLLASERKPALGVSIVRSWPPAHATGPSAAAPGFCKPISHVLAPKQTAVVFFCSAKTRNEENCSSINVFFTSLAFATTL